MLVDMPTGLSTAAETAEQLATDAEKAANKALEVNSTLLESISTPDL